MTFRPVAENLTKYCPPLGPKSWSRASRNPFSNSFRVRPKTHSRKVPGGCFQASSGSKRLSGGCFQAFTGGAFRPTPASNSIPCTAHELHVYQINATGEIWVCMYTSINIVSLCISFRGPPKTICFIDPRCALNCKNPHRQRGLGNIHAQLWASCWLLGMYVCMLDFKTPHRQRGLETYIHTSARDGFLVR